MFFNFYRRKRNDKVKIQKSHVAFLGDPYVCDHFCRNSVRTLIELQTEDYPDSEIKAEQERLNRLYDTFSGKYGLINSRANTSAFSQDSSFSLLSALEIIGEDGELERKETIDTNTYGKSSGRSGNYSTNYQISGRELLTPDEVRMLDNQYAILFIRGERPVMDFKYDILKHPNVVLTTDGKASAYKHGEVTVKHSSISVLSLDPKELPEENYGETTYELLSDEDFEVNKNIY